MTMKFIEMQGKTLMRVISPEEFDPDQLKRSGVRDDSLVRINLQGDIELRKRDRWEIIGGLLGDYADRARRISGLDFA